MLYTQKTKQALRIAFEAHAGQTDKAGLPYICHPLHLAEEMPDEDTVVTALLHDVLEDSDYTPEKLAAFSFGEAVLTALRLLTHGDEVPYKDYILALRENRVARTVKLADLRHNSDLTRLENITEQDKKRAAKYKEAIAILETE